MKQIKKIKMYSIKKNTLSLIFIVALPYLAYSQTEEIECLKTFNSLVYENLLNIDTNDVDVSSNNIKIIFELYVSECGKIDSAFIKKTNLNKHAISQKALLSSIIGKKIPCLRDIYYISKPLPDKIIIVYNTKVL